MNYLNFFKNYLIPSYIRLFLTAFGVYIYYNTYKKISGGIIPVLIFPSFYIAYMVFMYPENLNWRNKNPTIPGENGFYDELNKLIKDPYYTVIIFIPIYLLITGILYHDKIKKLHSKFKSRKKKIK